MVRLNRVNTRTGWIAGLLLIPLYTAACAGTPKPAVTAPSSTSACTDFPGPGGTAASIASQCSARADDSDILGRESAIAYFHAAKAYNDLSDHAAAADMAAHSFDELRNEDPWLTTPPSGLSAADLAAWSSVRRTFQLDRVVQYAKAYSGLVSTGSLAAVRGAPCTRNVDCLSMAINKMNEERRVADSFADRGATPRSPQYDSYYLLLAELYQARASATDTEPAIAAYQNVASSPLASATRAEAREKLASMTVALGDAAKAKKDPASAGLAIRYYNIAREARPEATAPLLGLGEVYRDIGTASRDANQLRSAEQAYTAALAQAQTDAEMAAAYSGRGAARDAIAELLGTSRTGALEDYEAASRYADSAEVFLVLARACQASGNWYCADKNFSDAIARLKADGATGRQVAVALIDQAEVRANLGLEYTPGDVRSVLQEAVLADPGSAVPVIRLARHDMRQGNWTGAETGFLKIAGSSPGALVNADAYRAEANAELSKLNALRPNSNLVKAVEYADEALRLDSANPLYRKQACLARVYRGSTSVTLSSNAAKCSVGTDVDALLLQAMFEMRRAQYAGVSSAAQIRRQSRDFIDSALDVVTIEDITDFDWPDESSLPPVKTKAILLYLKEATLACGGNYSFNLPNANGISGSDYSSARVFLDFYGSRLCT